MNIVGIGNRDSPTLFGEVVAWLPTSKGASAVVADDTGAFHVLAHDAIRTDESSDGRARIKRQEEKEAVERRAQADKLSSYMMLLRLMKTNDPSLTSDEFGAAKLALEKKADEDIRTMEEHASANNTPMDPWRALYSA